MKMIIIKNDHDQAAKLHSRLLTCGLLDIKVYETRFKEDTERGISFENINKNPQLKQFFVNDK